MSALGDGAAQRIGNHRAAVLLAAKQVKQQLVAAGAVVIVGIDHRKRRVDAVCGAEHRVSGAPGLGAPLRDRKALRQRLQRLEGVAHLHKVAQPAAHALLKGRLHLGLDDKDHRLKAGAPGVVDRVIQNLLPILAHRVNLL